MTTIITSKPSVWVRFSTLPLHDELDLIHQVTENNTVVKQTPTRYYKWDDRFVAGFVWKSKLHHISSRVVVAVFYKLRIMLNQNNTIYVYDGPGVLSERLKLNTALLLLSGNQAFCVIYSLIYMGKYFNFKTVNLKYDADYKDIIRVHITDNRPVILPSCDMQSKRVPHKKLFHSEDKSKKLEIDSGNKNLFCTYNITSTSGYINLSISDMRIRGFDWGSGFNPCFLGGAAFRTALHWYTEEEAKKSSVRSISATKHHTRYMCDNYTSKYNMKGRFDKSMMDIISHTKKGLIFAVYSYNHYSQVHLNAIVTSTPCKGYLNYKSSSMSFLLIFDWLVQESA